MPESISIKPSTGKIYAQINATGKVKAVTQTPGEIIAADMIEVESFDISLLGQKYNATTKAFTPESPDTTPSKQEQIANQINQAGIDYAALKTTNEGNALLQILCLLTNQTEAELTGKQETEK